MFATARTPILKKDMFLSSRLCRRKFCFPLDSGGYWTWALANYGLQLPSLQMFIGEMGCWLIVGCFSLNKMWKDNRRQRDGYEPVSAGEPESSSVGPAVKPLVKNADGRIPITGWKVFLLAIPACCDIAGTTLMNVGFLFVAASSKSPP